VFDRHARTSAACADRASQRFAVAIGRYSTNRSAARRHAPMSTEIICLRRCHARRVGLVGHGSAKRAKVLGLSCVVASVEWPKRFLCPPQSAPPSAGFLAALCRTPCGPMSVPSTAAIVLVQPVRPAASVFRLPRDPHAAGPRRLIVRRSCRRPPSLSAAQRWFTTAPVRSFCPFKQLKAAAMIYVSDQPHNSPRESPCVEHLHYQPIPRASGSPCCATLFSRACMASISGLTRHGRQGATRLRSFSRGGRSLSINPDRNAHAGTVTPGAGAPTS